MCVWERESVCVSECVCERVCVWERVWERESVCEWVCMCVCERESVWVSVCERERGNMRGNRELGSVCVCVRERVCVRRRERYVQTFSFLGRSSWVSARVRVCYGLIFVCMWEREREGGKDLYKRVRELRVRLCVSNWSVRHKMPGTSVLKSLGASRAERGGGNAGCDQATHTCAPETAALSPFASNLLTFVSAAYTLLVLLTLC